MKPSGAKAIFIPTLSLFLICLIITVVLALTNAVTAEKIAENEAESKQASMTKVCAGAKTFEEAEKDVLYIGLDQDKNVVGYAVSTSASGYGGPVKVMTGISPEGEILGVDVYYNDDETPGLGKNTSNESFSGQYRRLSALKEIFVSKDSKDGQTVDAVTSATISSRAVTTAVNEAGEIFKKFEETKSVVPNDSSDTKEEKEGE